MPFRGQEVDNTGSCWEIRVSIPSKYLNKLQSEILNLFEKNRIIASHTSQEEKFWKYAYLLSCCELDKKLDTSLASLKLSVAQRL